MERELKFRAWSKSAKKMLLNPAITDGSDGGSTAYVDLNAGLVDDDLIFMQCTGLKDKNGKEIYDGDVIEWDWDYGRKEIEQVMHSGDWDGRIDSSRAPFMSAWGSTCGRYFRTFMNVYDPTRYATVIGNIYENPELVHQSTL